MLARVRLAHAVDDIGLKPEVQQGEISHGCGESEPFSIELPAPERQEHRDKEDAVRESEEIPHPVRAHPGCDPLQDAVHCSSGDMLAAFSRPMADTSTDAPDLRALAA